MSEQTPNFLTATRDADRLDVFLSEELPNLSRNKARALCESGAVKINGHAAAAGKPVRSGDSIELPQIEAVQASAANVSSELPSLLIHFENERYLVAEKPRAMASVRLRAEDPTTLADLIAAYDERCVTASPDPREAGLVQRLDFFTSGLVLAAKTRTSWEELHTELLAGRIAKTYLAIVEGVPKRKRISVDRSLRQTADGKGMELAEAGELDGTFPASTSVELLRELSSSVGKCALVRAAGFRVRRHQIRIHLASTGHPLIGDTKYGSTRSLAEVLPGLDGFLLHAETIRFHDGEAERYFESKWDAPA